MANWDMIPLAQITVEGVGEYDVVLSVQIDTGANAHGTMICILRLVEETVFVSENDRADCLVTVKLNDGTKLFSGVCTDCKFQTMSEYAEMRLVVKGYSYFMDKEHHSRTFQDVSKTLRGILEQIMDNYDGVIIIQQDIAVPEIIVQDNETDWEFVVRISNFYGMDVYSNKISEKIILQIGTDVGKVSTLGDNDVLICESKNLEEMRLLSNYEGQDYATYQFRETERDSSNIHLAAGWIVGGNVIQQTRLKSDKGVLINRVNMQKASTSRSSYQGATAFNLKTRVLTGEVLEVNGTNVKVKFDIDKEQDISTALEIPYENVMNNSFYCMPDVHDKVYAYVDNMGETVVLGSRRKEISDEFFDHVEEKAITSLDNMIRFRSNGIEFMANREKGNTDANAKVSLSLNNEEGICIHGTGKMTITAIRNIYMVASNNTFLNIDDQIYRLLKRYEEKVNAGEDLYRAAAGDNQEFDNGITRWFKDAGNDIKESTLNFLKGVSLYNIWGNKENVQINNEEETFGKGTISVYGNGIDLFCGQGEALIRLGHSDESFVYVNADYFSWLGLNPQNGYSIVSDSVKSSWDNIWNGITIGLDIIASVCTIVSFVFPPAAVVTGPLAIAALSASVGISTTRGDYAGALLSAVPLAGSVGPLARSLENAPKIGRAYFLATNIICTATRITGTIGQAYNIYQGLKNYEQLEDSDKILFVLQGLNAILGIFAGVADEKKWRNNIIKDIAMKQPDIDAAQTKTTTTAGDPVDMVTGALLVSYTDIVIPDVLKEFRLVRTYRSVYENKGGMLGDRWQYNVESRLKIDEDAVAVLLPDLHKELFVRTESGWHNNVAGKDRYQLKSDKDRYIVFDAIDKETFVYDKKGRIQGQYDQNGNETRYEYQGDKLIKMHFTSGQEIVFCYEKELLSVLRDKSGKECRFKYQNGLLTQVALSNQGKIVYEYTKEGFLRGITNENGKCYVTNQFDRQGRVVRQQTADGEEYIFMYHPVEKYNIITRTSDNTATAYHYNKKQLVERIVYANGAEVIKRYDHNEQVVYEKNENGQEIYRRYRKDGKIREEVMPSGYTMEYSYDEMGNLIQKNDNMGRKYVYSYDSKGNMLTFGVLLESDRWAYNYMEYDSYGRLLSITDANGNKKAWQYHTLYAHPSCYIGSNGGEILYDIDMYGRVMAEQSDRGIIEYCYNSLNGITSVTDEDGNRTQKIYDATGKITKIIRPNENGKTEYYYDGMDHLTSVIDPCGAVSRMYVNSDGKITKFVSANAYDEHMGDGEGTRFEYDERGNLVKTIYVDGSIERRWYDVGGNLIKIVHPEEYSQFGEESVGENYQYDECGRLVSITDTAGKIQKAFVYDLAGRIIKQIDGKGYDCKMSFDEMHGTMYSYNLVGWLKEIRTPVAYDKNGIMQYRLVKYAYDLCGNQIEEKRYLDYQTKTTARGKVLVISKEYDMSNRLVKVRDTTGAVIVYEYNVHNQCIREKSRINQNIWKYKKFDYYKNGRLRLVAESADEEGSSKQFRETFFRYDSNGNIISITTPSGNKILREYDACDRMIQESHVEKNGDIHQTVFYKYDKVGNLIEQRNKEGILEQREYDLKNLLIRKIGANKGITVYQYDKNQRLFKVVSPNENSLGKKKGITYHYDNAGRLSEEYRADGNLNKSYQYNQYNELISVRDAAGHGVDMSYDFAGRRQTVQTMGRISESYGYDCWGRVIYTKDGEGNKTYFNLDAWGRIQNVIKADGSEEKYVYDYAGNVIQIVDGEGNKTQFHYNTMNMPALKQDGEGRLEKWFYDLEGNVARHEDRNGNVIHYKYNMYGSMTKRWEENTGIQESWGYDNCGRLIYADGGGIRYQYSYDSCGNLLEKRCGNKILLAYTYDLNCNKITMTDQTGKTVKYRYDENDMLIQVLDADVNKNLARYEYNGDLTQRRVQIGDDIWTSYLYDENKNMTELITEVKYGRQDNSEVLINNRYTYDYNGNMLSKRMLSGEVYYEYNRINMLKKVNMPGLEEKYHYDHAGNRISKVTSELEVLYNYDASNRLLETIEIPAYGNKIIKKCEYDQNGNMISDGINTYSYDVWNRNTMTQSADGNIQINHYDAENLRYEMEENGQLYAFVFGDREIITEDNETEGIRRYIRGLQLISCDSVAARTYYHYVSNEAGDITHVLSDASQPVSNKVLNSYTYDAYGGINSAEEKVRNRFAYRGEMYDRLTGQYYLRARYYNPAIGRFLQEDTYYNDGLNLYNYCKNNPVYYADPSGHEVMSATERLNANQAALFDIAGEVNAKGGASIDEAAILMQWAAEYGVPYENLNIQNQRLLSGQSIDYFVRPNGEVVIGADYIKYADIFANSKYFDQKNGDIRWPGQNGDPNIDGFINGQRMPDVLKEGVEYERFGDNGNAHYYTEVGASLGSRALPPGSEYKKTIKIVPLEDIPCESGIIAPWFGQPGMGKQFYTKETRNKLQSQGKILVEH